MGTGRLLASQMEIRYIGAAEYCSGAINVGATIFSGPSTSPEAQACMTTNQIVNMLTDKKFRAGESIKLTWYPVDGSCMDF